MSEIKLTRRYPDSKPEDISDAFMRGFECGLDIGRRQARSALAVQAGANLGNAYLAFAILKAIWLASAMTVLQTRGDYDKAKRPKDELKDLILEIEAAAKQEAQGEGQEVEE